MEPRNKLRYEADLEKESLGSLLVKIYSYRVPGVIEAVSEEFTKRLYVRNGYVIYATSNDPQDRLDLYLLNQKLIEPEQFEEITRERARSNERAGVLMIRSGLISPLGLREALRAQIELIAWSLFSWKEGKVSFHIQEQQESNRIRIQIPLRHMVFCGMRDYANATYSIERLGGEKSRYEPCWDAEELIDIGLDRTAFNLLQLVDGMKSTGQLIQASSLERDATIRLLASFEVLRLIRARKNDKPELGVTIRLKTAGGTFS